MTSRLDTQEEQRPTSSCQGTTIGPRCARIYDDIYAIAILVLDPKPQRLPYQGLLQQLSTTDKSPNFITFENSKAALVEVKPTSPSHVRECIPGTISAPMVLSSKSQGLIYILGQAPTISFSSSSPFPHHPKTCRDSPPCLRNPQCLQETTPAARGHQSGHPFDFY